MDVYVSGVGMTPFGKHENKSLKDLLVEAARAALHDADYPRIDAVIVGNFMGGAIYNQEILGAIVVNDLNLGSIPALKVEGACASGGIAIRQAILGILSGEYENVLVVGGEKMKHASTETVTQAINAAMDNQSLEKNSGLTFPAFFGLLANRYFFESGATKKHLAYVAKQNRDYAVNNPLAQFRKPTTIEEVLEAKMITDPLGLFDCSPITDGAASVVISKQKTGIKLKASVQVSGPTSIQHLDSILKIPAIVESGRKAYTQAGIGPEDLDVVEVHDCFTITQLLAIEGLGFAKELEAWKFIEEGETGLSGKTPLNTSGGLLSRGHPIGATGIAQFIQIVLQLRGQAPNQVDNASLGMAQNLGGTGAYSVIHILERV
ncbi:acetyl-CoA C-acetyltransferase [Lysinibacillus composti]|uniref:propanoyl-CoA C-acyltransferase n=1 Tax=Lysinibacillus composti TaxID=720633 RepID=A0A3N9UBQ2_9BACI|nr:thiolase domain-containing protein [Lysinibacillus composti]MBM7610270.1 acetyl-CoA C-acetyltransferase [Lysinibacillus composti]RQW73811.1 thiolase domain-containing protein [Lysinibacillus composti]